MIMLALVFNWILGKKIWRHLEHSVYSIDKHHPCRLQHREWPVQRLIRAAAWHKISIGFFVVFPSKHALFRAFQIAQQMADIPHKWNFLPIGSHDSHHSQHWEMEVGVLVTPITVAITPQTTFAIEHVKNKWSIVYACWSQNWHMGFPDHIMWNIMGF